MFSRAYLIRTGYKQDSIWMPFMIWLIDEREVAEASSIPSLVINSASPTFLSSINFYLCCRLGTVAPSYWFRPTVCWITVWNLRNCFNRCKRCKLLDATLVTGISFTLAWTLDLATVIFPVPNNSNRACEEKWTATPHYNLTATVASP